MCFHCDYTFIYTYKPGVIDIKYYSTKMNVTYSFINSAIIYIYIYIYIYTHIYIQYTYIFLSLFSKFCILLQYYDYII